MDDLRNALQPLERKAANDAFDIAFAGETDGITAAMEMLFRQHADAAIRTALEAMETPSEAMLRAGADVVNNGDGTLWRRRWQAMLAQFIKDGRQ